MTVSLYSFELELGRHATRFCLLVRMASRSKSVALFFLASLLPMSVLQGVPIAACILALLIPWRGLWCQSCRVAARRKPALRISKEQKSRAHQKQSRALWMHGLRERQRRLRVLWKMTRGFCMSTDCAASGQVAGADDHQTPDICGNRNEKISFRNTSCLDRHCNSAAEPSANPSGSSVSIICDADAIIIPGFSQASAQQAEEASAASFGGEILCDPVPFAYSAHDSNRVFAVESAAYDCQDGYLSVAQVQVACILEMMRGCLPYPHEDIRTWRLMSVKTLSEYAYAFA